tara:strand:+ start:1734 stop:2318 length:585 start_codon:yes stop_codon:yes gene_type:complete
MGNRRLSRKRLLSLEKRGQKVTKSDLGMGAGMSGTFVRCNKMRDGSLVVVELVLDLGTSAAVVASHAANDVIGVDGASGTIFTWDASIHGYLIDLEMLVLETPTTGDDDLHIYYHSAEINANAAGNGGTDSAVDITTAVKGRSHSAAIGTGDLSSLQYFYIVSDGSTAGTYAAGKILIRTTGFVLDEDATDTFV